MDRDLEVGCRLPGGGQYRSGHKKLERRSGPSSYEVFRTRGHSGGGGGGGGRSKHHPRGGGGDGGPHVDVKRYTGANLVKKNSSKGGSGGGGGEALTTLQKRALDLTGAPLISYSNGGAADKERAYRSQSLNPDPTGIPSGPYDSGIQQLQQQMLFLRQLQAAQQQQLQQFPRYDVYDSGHGSLDGSSCGGSDYDLRAPSAGSAENESCGMPAGNDTQAGAVGASAGRGKRALESANSMPILSQFSASPIQPHTDQDCMLLEDNGYDVEIEVEEERKFLPTDLFAEGAAGGHEKLSSSKSVGGRWDSNTRAGIINKRSQARKTFSLNMTNSNNNDAEEDEEEELPDSSRADGFTLFSSDQLDLLSSVRSNWNKSCHNDSCSAAVDNDSFEATLMAAGGGSSYFGPRGSHQADAEREGDQLGGLKRGKAAVLESAIKNLSHDMSAMLLRKI